ncbi:TnsA-like heteromeric transposase endonuclease subunit [Streptomyces sp. NPDC005708]|uniref:TnsA-like heteromeric transposase endonuclease subunit n=1 Tax=Streptomyces sp. NPDC005708 TaxID=3154564 RepID=UPI0033C1F00D
MTQLLAMEDGWPTRWTTTWMVQDGKVTWPLRNVGSVPVRWSGQVRRFTWHARQKHRPGLQFMLSTGRLHGFESLAEQSVLLVLDFLGAAEVLPQPFELGFDHRRGRSRHVPDFLAMMPDGYWWLLDVRPEGRVEDEDRLKFAAAREAAVACGWQYAAVTGWRPHVITVLDHLSSQRRKLTDQLGLQGQLLTAVDRGPLPFGDLVEGTRLPAVARAHATHLLWHRRLGVDLGSPLGDRSMVWLAAQPGRRR